MRPLLPDGQQVVFNFRMPGDAHKVMLFEKIDYMIDRNINLRQEEMCSGRATHSNLFEETIKMMRHTELIGEIRRSILSGLSRCKCTQFSGGGSSSGGGQ